MSPTVEVADPGRDYPKGKETLAQLGKRRRTELRGPRAWRGGELLSRLRPGHGIWKSRKWRQRKRRRGEARARRWLRGRWVGNDYP